MKTRIAVLLLLLPLAAPAADLSIALGGDVTSMDPHFHNLTPNNNIGAHVFDTLVAKDAAGRIKPALAESWRAVDDTTWEFKLRKGVRFHDGSIFTAAAICSTSATPAVMARIIALPISLYAAASSGRSPKYSTLVVITLSASWARSNTGFGPETKIMPRASRHIADRILAK